MKITNSIKQNNSSEYKRQNIVFGAGLTPKMMKEIQRADVLEISEKLGKKGIPTDFSDNKVIAWCCDKTIEIFEYLNKKYHTNIAFPKGIFVKDFEDLNIENPKMYGFCNLQPFPLIKGNKDPIPSRVLFFNNFKKQQEKIPEQYKWLFDWNYINEISDIRFYDKNSGSDFFLDLFMHEFTHVFHEDRLLNKYGGEVLAEKINMVKDKQKIAEYQSKYGSKISEICNYALSDPFEAIACDAPRVIESCLDKETLVPTKNPFIDTPYEKLHFWQPKRIKIPMYNDQDRPLKEILRNFWNGEFN